MTTLEQHVTAYRDLIVASFDNAMNTVEVIHQTFAEMSVDVLQELGLPEGPADAIKDKHHRLIHIWYDGISTANHALGDLVIQQWSQINEFAEPVTETFLGYVARVMPEPPAAPAAEVPRARPTASSSRATPSGPRPVG